MLPVPPTGWKPRRGAFTIDVTPAPRRDGTGHMVAGAAVSALGAYLFTVIGGRGLGEVEFAPIALLWTLQFLGFTVLYSPLEQFLVRRLTLTGGRAESIRSAMPLLAAVVVAGAALAVAFVGVRLDESFQGEPAFLFAAAVLFAGLGSYAIARGFLAGRRRFRAYGVVVALEAVVRITLTVVVLIVVDSAVGLSWALALTPFTWFVVRPFRRTTDYSPALRDDAQTAGRFISGLMVMTAASQALLAGGPLVVDALDAPEAEVSIFFVVFTLFRGPLTASYNLLSRILPWFTTQAAQGDDRALTRTIALVGAGGTALAAAGAAAGAVLGPPIVGILYGNEFRPDALLGALAAAGVVLAAAALFLGQLLVARGTTGVLGAVWTVALLVALAVLVAVNGDPGDRVAWGFLAGEATALALTVAAAVRGRRR